MTNDERHGTRKDDDILSTRMASLGDLHNRMRDDKKTLSIKRDQQKAGIVRNYI
jgi:hypothetical protein